MESMPRGRFHAASGLPILRIHSGGISFGNMSQVKVQLHGKHDVDVVCRECECALTVHASKKGAFAQITHSQPTTVYEMLSREDAAGYSDAQQIPPALRQLFRTPDGDAFEIGGRPPEPVLRSSSRRTVQDDADYDLMFGGDEEPWVGSYPGLGEIDTDHLDLKSPVDSE
jgi:hypothetical protein